MMNQPKIAAPSNYNRVTAIVQRAFRVLLAIVILSVIYRYCWIDDSDPYKCSALLNKGSWLDPGRAPYSPNQFTNWQPPGCLMHEYKKSEIQKCFQERRLVFIGDSTTRQIFWSMAKKMDHDWADKGITEMLELDEKHIDLEFRSNGVKFQFIWDPWLNSTSLESELKKFKANPSLDSEESDESPSLILLGAPGLWNARHGSENYFKNFKDSIDRVIPYMDHLTQQTKTLPISMWTSARKAAPNLLLLTPVQVPSYESLSPSRVETITPPKIDQMNDYLQQVSAHSSADVVWSYSSMISAGFGEYEESGLHVVENVAHQKADILLNLRCNAEAARRGYPFNRTCCSNYAQPRIAQASILLLGMLGLPMIMCVRRKRFLTAGRLLLPSQEVLNAMTVLGLVVCFCYYADRTQVFEKAQKQFVRREFLAGCVSVLAIGLLTIRKNKTRTKFFPASNESGLLSRDQTDEWKGWMQAILLIYHFSHGSQTLPIYEVVRLLVASYLFMTGFGHTLYFLRSDDFSLKRVFTVLIRLNLLSCVLPYMMRTEYLFYYFAPMVSFWFLVTYFTFKIGRQRNSNLGFVTIKIILSAVFTTAFTKIPGVLEFVSLILKYTCAISWNLKEWRFRVFLDMYVVYVGMILAVLYQRSSRPSMPIRLIDQVLHLTKLYSEIFSFILFFAPLFLIPGFWVLIRRSPDKEDYNWWQPYISFVPILCFVALRNCHVVLRKYHSKAFAWLGRCSLETYVLQYHIWLAGDTAGLLRIGLWGPWPETAILTPLFLWISWCTADATQKVAAWIVSDTSSSPTNRGKHDDEAKNSPYLLPRSSNGDGAPSKDWRLEFGRGKTSKSLGWFVTRVSESLKWRFALVVILLWVGNITYA